MKVGGTLLGDRTMKSKRWKHSAGLFVTVLAAGCGSSDPEVVRIAANVTPAAATGPAFDLRGPEPGSASQPSEPLSTRYQKNLASMGVQVLRTSCVRGPDGNTTTMGGQWWAIFEISSADLPKVSGNPWYGVYDPAFAVGAEVDCASKSL